MGDIVRLVEEAQSREAPVQRLADKVLQFVPYIFCRTYFIFNGIKGSFGRYIKNTRNIIRELFDGITVHMVNMDCLVVENRAPVLSALQ